ncbi:MAG: hypothetical protein K6G16_10480 [Lachnospiraceae bacterium]|nr:hypothetical protein [Lachnospiraceae bacterium]
MNETENRSLKQAIEDLNNVNSEGHGKSGKYTRMERALETLTGVIAKYYPQSGQEAPKLSAQALKEIRDAYSEAIRRCNEYTSGKGDTRRSGYGQGRLNCVKEITRILNQDMLAVSDARESDLKTLPEVISRGRLSETQITEENLKFAKGGMTSRIPLAIRTADGVCEGFFTQDKKQQSVSELMEEINNKYDLTTGPLEKLTRSALQGGEQAKKTLLSNLSVVADQISKLTDMVKRNIRSNPITAERYLGKLVEAMVPDENERRRLWIELNEAETLNDFVDFVMEAGDLYGILSTNANKGGIPEGEDIPKRNVAASRMADMLGMGHLVARAERMQLKDKDGNTITGVFQERATGSDSHRLKADDPLRELGDHPEMLDDPEILRQLSDIQVMDYIIGNTDRHEGNLMYQMKEVDGQMKLVGVKAIDNDMSMGTLRKDRMQGKGRYNALPEHMKIIRKDRADAIMAMDKKKLRLQYQDLNFTEAELEAAMDRIRDVQRAIKYERIAIVEDKDFAKYKFSDLGNRGRQFGPNAPRENLFDIISDMQRRVKTQGSAPEEQQITYNAAQSIEKQYRRDGVIHAQDLTAQLDTLEEIRDRFVATDSKWHWDSGPFKLMKTTLNDCIDTIRAMQEKYQGAAELSAEDAEKLERAYRQLRQASGGYAAGHSNPSSPMGQARREGALTMKDLWPPRLEPPKPMVNEINLEEMVNKNGVQNPERKESRRGAAGKQVVSRSMDDDDDFVIEGEEKGSRNGSADDDDDFVIEGGDMQKESRQSEQMGSQKSSSGRVL